MTKNKEIKDIDFSVATSSEIIETVTAALDSDKYKSRVISLVSAITPVLVNMRDNTKDAVNFTEKEFQKRFFLEELESFISKGSQLYDKEKWQTLTKPLMSYVQTLPSYDAKKEMSKQAAVVREEFAFAVKEIQKALKKIADEREKPENTNEKSDEKEKPENTDDKS